MSRGTSSQPQRASGSRASELVALHDYFVQVSAATVDSFETKLRDFKFLGGQRFEIGGEDFDLADPALAAFFGMVQIPADLPPRLGKGLGALVLRCLIEGDESIANRPLRIVHSANSVVAITSPDLACLSNEVLVGVIRDAWPTGISSETVSVSEFRLSETEFELSFHTDKLVSEPRRGDILRGGISIRHSQAGLSPTTILSFVYRVVCANGLTQRVCLGGKPARTKRCKASNSSQQTLDSIRSQIAEAWSQLDERMEGFKKLLEHRLELNALPEMLRRRWSINRRLAEAIASALAEDELGRTFTEYDLVNALSRVATHSDLAPRYRRHLSLAAGLLAQRHVHQCRTCGSWLEGIVEDSSDSSLQLTETIA